MSGYDDDGYIFGGIVRNLGRSNRHDDQNIDWKCHQLRGEGPQSGRVEFGVARLDQKISTFDPPQIAQTLAQSPMGRLRAWIVG